MKKLIVFASLIFAVGFHVSAQNSVVKKETKMEQPKQEVTEAKHEAKHDCSKSEKSCCSKKATNATEASDKKSCDKDSKKSCCSKKAAEGVKKED
jgi:hypothetical protein